MDGYFSKINVLKWELETITFYPGKGEETGLCGAHFSDSTKI